MLRRREFTLTAQQAALLRDDRETLRLYNYHCELESLEELGVLRNGGIDPRRRLYDDGLAERAKAAMRRWGYLLALECEL